MLNGNGVKTVNTVTGDMICHRYRAFVKVWLKPKSCVCKHFEQFSFSLLTYVFSLFMSVIRLQFLQNVIDIPRDGYYNQWIIHVRYFLLVGTVIFLLASAGGTVMKNRLPRQLLFLKTSITFKCIANTSQSY